MFDTLTERVTTLPTWISERQQTVRRTVKQAVYQARQTGTTGLWNLNLKAIERASGIIERAAELPGLDRVSPSARDVLSAYERVTTSPPLEGYDELNVRKIMHELRDLDGFGLMSIQRYESAHKNRKTVLDAIERELERRERLAAA